MPTLNTIAQIPHLVPSIIALVALWATWKFARNATGIQGRRKALLWVGCLGLLVFALGVESVRASDLLIDADLMPSWGFNFLSWLTGWPISAADVQTQ